LEAAPVSRRALATIAAVVGLSLLAAGCGSFRAAGGGGPSAPESAAAPASRAPAPGAPEPAVSPAAASNEAFRVDRLTLSGALLEVDGRARVFEGGFVAETANAAGVVLARASVQASAGAPAWGDFRAELRLPGTPSEPLTLRLYEPSPKDGTPAHLLSLPVPR
jgi:hypothetical protein